MSNPTMRTVRFLYDCDGYAAGQIIDFEPGMADAYVNWRKSATFVDPEPKAKAIVAPPLNKMMQPAAVRAKELRGGLD